MLKYFEFKTYSDHDEQDNLSAVQTEERRTLPAPPPPPKPVTIMVVVMIIVMVTVLICIQTGETREQSEGPSRPCEAET